MLYFWCSLSHEERLEYRPFIGYIIHLSPEDAVKTLEEGKLPMARNTKKKTTTKTQYGADINLWYADDGASYQSRGEIKFTRGHLEELIDLFDEYAEEDSFKGEAVLRVPFFLRDAKHYSDEFGSLATQLVRDREVE